MTKRVVIWRRVVSAIAAGIGVAASVTVHAQSVAPLPLLAASAAMAVHAPVHPWQVAAPHSAADAYFTNLEDNATIQTPYLLKFGLSGGWGVAPIAKPLGGKSGHHHLLINRDLPLDFKKALPFNEQYVHFGKGQMETVLTLDPGTYTLRLLLADSGHLPHFVYSKPVRVTVTAKNKAIDPKSLVVPGIALLHIAPGQALKRPVHLQFHASGFNIGFAEQKEKGTGHFRLTVSGASGKPAEMVFDRGQTEAWISPPPGSYTFKLELMDNTERGKTMVASPALNVKVE